VLNLILTITLKDLRSEFRGKEAINASLAFSVVVLLILSFAFDMGEIGIEPEKYAGGLLWIVYAFAGVLIFNRSFARELPNDCLDALIAAPIPGPALFLGKTFAAFLLVFGVEIVCLPVFANFYDVHILNAIFPLIGIIALGTWTMAVVGVFFSLLTINIRLRELMLPVIFYPMLIPALLGAIQITSSLLSRGYIGNDNEAWVRLLAGCSIIFTALGVSLIDFILAT
jgi:heme exporter protein B